MAGKEGDRDTGGRLGEVGERERRKRMVKNSSIIEIAGRTSEEKRL